MIKLIKKTVKFCGATKRRAVISSIIIGFCAGFIFRGDGEPSVTHKEHSHESGHQVATQKTEVWTCSMHPQIRQPQKGKCPICGMDLIPASSGEESSVKGELKVSAHAMKMAQIQTRKVERKFVSNEIRMVGKVEYDETRFRYITARVPGRIDRLYVDYTGTPVRKGDHLVYIYSPELITAQKELQQSYHTFKKIKKGVNPTLSKNAERMYSAAREKLRLLGVTKEQINKIQKLKKPDSHLTIYSPMKGVVVNKNAVEGLYIKTGTKIYTIADLSHLWLKLDAYESDLKWIRYGQQVEFEVEAYPGETFRGQISFIDPVLNSKTRTIKIRVNVKNKQLKLKPEMFVKAVVKSKLSETGRVLNAELAGKWISPMHPEIVKNAPGKCDVCGMPLVKAEKLGYSSEEFSNEAPMVIPVSAPLITGTRAIVYVTVKGRESTFISRQIKLGPRAGDYYIVKEGLNEDDQVVVNGAFKIDSDLQIQAQPSMMSSDDAVVPIDHHSHGKSGEKKTVHQHFYKNISKVFRTSLEKLLTGYFEVQYSLSADNVKEAKDSAVKTLSLLKKIDMKLIKGKAHMDWMKYEATIKKSIHGIIDAGDIDKARVYFETFSGAMTDSIMTFGLVNKKVYRFHCPMAFNNKGASWLQDSDKTRNPFFGSSMLTCQDAIEELKPGKKK